MKNGLLKLSCDLNAVAKRLAWSLRFSLSSVLPSTALSLYIYFLTLF